MNIILGFKIWYSKSTVSGQNYDDWVRCPDDDVQVVMLYFKNLDGEVPLRQIAAGNDYYSLTKAMVLLQGDDESLLIGHIKHGAWTDDNLVDKLQAKAMTDNGEGWLWHPKPAEPPSKGGV